MADIKVSMIEVKIKPENCEAKTLPQGIIYLGPSTLKQSIGFLKLLPGKQLAKHNRPVDEKLKQIKGSCVTELYDGNKLIQEVTLEEGDELIIPANQYHIHKNPFKNESLTYWQFDGDITEIIKSIKKSSE